MGGHLEVVAGEELCDLTRYLTAYLSGELSEESTSFCLSTRRFL
jgi:hypothetical protein